MKNGNGKRGLPFLAPLILLGLLLGIEMALGNRKAVLACLMAGGLYILLALPLFWIVGKIDQKGEKWDRPESPIGEFLNGDWIQGKGKWPLRFLLQLLPLLLLLGFAAWKIFSDGSENLETLLVFLAWALPALGVFGYLIYVRPFLLQLFVKCFQVISCIRSFAAQHMADIYLTGYHTYHVFSNKFSASV